MAPLTVATQPDRQILDALPVSLYAVELEGRVTFANRPSTQFAAAPRESADVIATESEPLYIWDVLAKLAPRERIEEAMRRLGAGHTQTVHWELSYRSPDEERAFLVQISPLAEGHSVTGFVFAIVDATASNQSRDVLLETGLALARTFTPERVLQEATQQLRRAIGCDAVAIALSEDGSQTLRLAYQVGFEHDRDTLEAMLTPRWQAALSALEEMHPTFSPGTQCVATSVDGGTELTAPLASDGVRGAVTVLLSLDSSLRHEDSERVLVAIATQIASALERAGLVTVLGERRRLEGIGEVAAGIAHQLRNPLFGISSAAQLLRYRVREDPVVEKNVGRILREVERLNGVVTSLLEYGRPAPSRMAAADPDEVWDRVLEAHRGLLESKALVLRHSAARPRVHCHLDTDQLAQAFGNMLTNAIDAAPEGSDLSLTSAPQPHGRWRCQLHNTGPAIAADALPHVFELFFSTKLGGSGIGLALCQRIVEEHGGTISIESTPESGTTVTVVLPTAENPS